MYRRERPKLLFSDFFSNFDRFYMPISRVYQEGGWIDMPGSGKLRQRNVSDERTS